MSTAPVLFMWGIPNSELTGAEGTAVAGAGGEREDGEASSRQKVSGVQDQWIVEFYPTPQCLVTHNMVLSIKSMLSVLPTEQQNKHNKQRGRRKPSEVTHMSITLMVGMI